MCIYSRLLRPRALPLLGPRLELGRLHEHLQHRLVLHRQVAVRVLLRIHRAKVHPLLPTMKRGMGDGAIGAGGAGKVGVKHSKASEEENHLAGRNQEADARLAAQQRAAGDGADKRREERRHEAVGDA